MKRALTEVSVRSFFKGKLYGYFKNPSDSTKIRQPWIKTTFCRDAVL